jgi:hypothetical protein
MENLELIRVVSGLLAYPYRCCVKEDIVHVVDSVKGVVRFPLYDESKVKYFTDIGVDCSDVCANNGDIFVSHFSLSGTIDVVKSDLSGVVGKIELGANYYVNGMDLKYPFLFASVSAIGYTGVVRVNLETKEVVKMTVPATLDVSLDNYRLVVVSVSLLDNIRIYSHSMELLHTINPPTICYGAHIYGEVIYATCASLSGDSILRLYDATSYELLMETSQVSGFGTTFGVVCYEGAVFQCGLSKGEIRILKSYDRSRYTTVDSSQGLIDDVMIEEVGDGSMIVEDTPSGEKLKSIRVPETFHRYGSKRA